MTTQNEVASEPSSMPYAWSPLYEAAFDSSAGRWLAFSAINRLEKKERIQLWKGRIAEALGFHASSISLRNQSWPRWMDDYFAASPIQFCPKCARVGYHSFFQQVRTLLKCPWHSVPLRTTCPRCHVPHAFSASKSYLQFECRGCGANLFPTNAACFARSASFLRLEQEAFCNMASALVTCNRLNIEWVSFSDETRQLTSPPPAEEVLVALASTGLLSYREFKALLPGAHPEIELVTHTPNRMPGESGEWESRLDIFTKGDAAFLAAECEWREHPLVYGAPAAWFLTDIRQRCARLRTRCDFRRMLLPELPALTASVWDLFLRAFLNDCMRSFRKVGPRGTDSSLRDMMYVQAPGRAPFWLYFRSLCADAS